MAQIFDRFLKPLLVVALAFALAGAASLPFLRLVKNYEAQNFGTLSTESLRAAVRNSSLFAVLGGYKSLVSDLIWIKSYVLWEKRDLSGCIASMELAATINPSRMDFWYFGSSIIAFDTPHWFSKSGVFSSPEAEKLIKKRQAKIAISFIDKGIELFPDNDRLLVQKGQIAMVYDDFKLAEKCFKIPASRENALFYPRRIYAALLIKNGKFKDALEVYEKLDSETEDDSMLKPVFARQIAEVKALIEKTSN